jgi:DNA polymerase (family 10)
MVPSMLRNADIAAAFEELGTLYELDGANRFRVLAYKDAAKVIRDCPQSIGEMALAGTATDLEGIGNTIQEKTVALIEEGEIPAATKLKEKYPAGLVEITRLPGIGAKTVRKMFDEVGITSVAELREAAEQERLRGVKGLGAKLEENVLAAIDRLEEEGPGERRLLDEVLEVGEALVADLLADPASDRVVLAGSARRWAETCKDIDIVATASDPEALGRVLLEHELAAESKNSGTGGARIRTHNGIGVDLRIVPPEEFGNLLQHFTGSKEHNVKLRERAVKMGMSVSEHGIKDTESGDVSAFQTEEEVYGHMGLAYIEPELRKGTNEIELAEKGDLPKLIELSDIKGDLHCHTTLSDGKYELTDMVAAALSRKYKYFAITDHSASHGFGNDVQADALLRRVEEIAELNAAPQTKGMQILAGSEVNIGTDGDLDYEDDVLAQLDWVVASVHTSFRMSADRMTKRVIAAIEHPLVDCIGHLTGRLLLKRDPYDINVEPIIEAAAANGTMIEINASPRRRDLNEHHVRMAVDAGVNVVINTDAHRVDTLLNNMQWGVATARRAGLTKDDIANTKPWRSFGPLRKRTKA